MRRAGESTGGLVVLTNSNSVHGDPGRDALLRLLLYYTCCCTTPVAVLHLLLYDMDVYHETVCPCLVLIILSGVHFAGRRVRGR